VHDRWTAQIRGWHAEGKLTALVFIASGGASGSRMDREVQEQPLPVLAEAGIHPRHRPGQVLADLAPRAKVVQTVVCSTFTRGAKPATRGWPTVRGSTPQGGVARSRQYRGHVEHQGDEHLKNRPRGARAPVAPVYGSGRPAFSTPYRPTRTRQDLPCTSAGEPRTRTP
jgi:hypothetical protein